MLCRRPGRRPRRGARSPAPRTSSRCVTSPRLTPARRVLCDKPFGTSTRPDADVDGSRGRATPTRSLRPQLRIPSPPPGPHRPARPAAGRRRRGPSSTSQGPCSAPASAFRCAPTCWLFDPRARRRLDRRVGLPRHRLPALDSSAISSTLEASLRTDHHRAARRRRLRCTPALRKTDSPRSSPYRQRRVGSPSTRGFVAVVSENAPP